MILVGDRLQVSPVAGETVRLKLTAPENPLTAVIVTVEVPGLPARIVTIEGLAVMVKS